jgi:hypothetical protein
MFYRAPLAARNAARAVAPSRVSTVSILRNEGEEPIVVRMVAADASKRCSSRRKLLLLEQQPIPEDENPGG